MEASGTVALRTAAPHWTLAGDKHLLDLLQDIHQKIILKCSAANTKLSEMASELDDASISLQNVNNRFMALSNSQFIESRVYDDDTDVTQEPPKVKEVQPVNPKDSISILKRSIQILERLHEPVHILQDSDTDTDSDDDCSRIVLKPKDVYVDRPLPYIIGSEAWKNKWHAGLVVEESDSDSSVSRPPREEEQYSESEPDLPTDKPHRKHSIVRTVSESSTELQFSQADSAVTSAVTSATSVRTPADIAADIARRLKPQQQTILEPEPQPEYVQKPVSRTVYKPQQPATSQIFSDEPPPLDLSESASEQEDDIFAELHKSTPYQHVNRDQSRLNRDLFGNQDSDGGDIFNDFKENKAHNIKPKSTLFEDESEPELFAEKQSVKSHKDSGTDHTDASNVKKPVGGISLFGSNKGTESIGAAILKRNQLRSTSDDDSDTQSDVKQTTIKQTVIPKTESLKDVIKSAEKNERVSKKDNIKSEKDIFEDLFVKSENIQKKSVKENNNKKVVKENKKVDLFSDNLFDDIDDIFTNVPKVPKNDTHKQKKSLFDDEDDLFAEIAVPKGSNEPKSSQSKGLFDSDDELFSQTTETETSKKSTINQEKIVRGNKESIPVYEGTKSLLDNNDTGIFIKATKDQKEDSKQIEIEAKGENKMKTTTVEDILEEDDDLFKNTETKLKFNTAKIVPTEKNSKLDSNVKTAEVKPKSFQGQSIFDDSDEIDELFTNKNIHKADSNIHSTSDLIDNNAKDELWDDETENDTKNSFEKQNITKVDFNAETKILIPKSFQNQTIFDDSDETDELFSRNKNEINKIDNTRSTNDSVRSYAKDEVYNEEIKKEFRKSESSDTVLIENQRNTTQRSILNDKVTEAISYDNNVQSESFRDTDVVNMLETERNVNKNENDSFDYKMHESHGEKPEDIFNENSQDDKTIFNQDSNDEYGNVHVNISKATETKIATPVDIGQEEKYIESPKKPDIFSDIFSEPPVFEKPKESKKSKNVNALFDDDSDDEALFFKRNDVTLDEKPVVTPNTKSDTLFGIFHDEPPAIDVDFSAKANSDQFDDELFKPPDVDETNDLFDIKNTPSDIESPNHETLKQQAKTTETKKSEYLQQIDTNFNKQEPLLKESINSNESAKKVGKLKSMDFNINVDALLPGASPKKIVKQIDVVDDTKVENRSISPETNVNIEPKIVKSVSFEGKPESEVLDNKLSKERAKIQVKRRPSSRKARRDAVRKSGLDFGEDSTDNSSSIDDPPKIKTITSPDQIPDSDRIEKSEANLPNPESSEEISNTTKNIEIVTPLDNPEISNLSTDLKTDYSNVGAKNVTSKIVYVLNDEDIFNTKPVSSIESTKISPKMQTAQLLDDDDDDIFKSIKPKEDKINKTSEVTGITTLGKTYMNESTKNIPQISDSKSNIAPHSEIQETSTKTPFENNESISKKDKKVSIFDSDDEDDLFGGKSKKDKIKNEVRKESKVDSKVSLFGDDSDDDLFGAKVKKIDDSAQPLPAARSSVKETSKPTEPVFEDPLSLLGDDDD